MNSTTIRTLGFALIGLATGGAVGLLVAGKLRADQLNEEAWIANMEESRKAYEEKQNAIAAQETYTVSSDDVIEGDEKEKFIGKEEYKHKISHIDYADISRKKKPPLKDIVPDDEDDGPIKDPKAKQMTPYLIDIDQYAEGDEDQRNEKVVLTYWSLDDYLSNEDQDVIQNGEMLLGPDWKSKFGQMSEDADIFHIRNNKEEIDYEVCRVKKSYKEEILGIKSKPKPKRPNARTNGIDKEEENR